MRKLVFVVAALVLAACGSSSPPKDAVVQVGDQTVHVAQLDALLRSARTYYAGQKKPFPKRESKAYARLRDQSIKRLIQGAIFVQEAEDHGVGVSDMDVDNAIETLKQEQYMGSDDRMQEALKEAGLTVDEFREQERVQLSESALENRVMSKVKVPTAVLLAYYRSHRSTYRTAPSRPVRHILVKTRQLADSLYRRLQSGASFQDLMHQYSTDAASRAGTGKMTDTKGLFVPPFERASFALSTGEVSKPVHTEFGWHLIQALGPVQPARTKPYSEVVGSIRAVLLPERQQKALKAFTDATYRSYCTGKISYSPGYSSSFCS